MVQPRPIKIDVNFNMRIDKALRDSFVAAAERCDKTAAQEIRAFMRQFVQKHGHGHLFTGGRGKSKI